MREDLILSEARASTTRAFDPRIRVSKTGNKVKVYVVNGGDRWDKHGGLILGYLDVAETKKLYRILGNALAEM